MCWNWKTSVVAPQNYLAHWYEEPVCLSLPGLNYMVEKSQSFQIWWLGVVLLMFMLFKAKDLLPGNEMGFSLMSDFTVSSRSVLAMVSVNEPYHFHDSISLGSSPCRHCDWLGQNPGASPWGHVPSWQEGSLLPFITCSCPRWPPICSAQGLYVEPVCGPRVS